jgi:hypothetical protein
MRIWNKTENLDCLCLSTIEDQGKYSSRIKIFLNRKKKDSCLIKRGLKFIRIIRYNYIHMQERISLSFLTISNLIIFIFTIIEIL